jgi:superfamily II DNA or RNA helicase
VHKEDGLDIERRNDFIKKGFLSEDEPILDRARRAKLTEEFSSGKLKKAIVTTVWNVGVSFNALSVLIRADGGGSPINDVQIPGRASRIDGDDKTISTVHDYEDFFNKALLMKSHKRRSSYRRQGWQEILPEHSPKNSLSSKVGLLYD